MVSTVVFKVMAIVSLFKEFWLVFPKHLVFYHTLHLLYRDPYCQYTNLIHLHVLAYLFHQFQPGCGLMQTTVPSVTCWFPLPLIFCWLICLPERSLVPGRSLVLLYIKNYQCFISDNMVYHMKWGWQLNGKGF